MATAGCARTAARSRRGAPSRPSQARAAAEQDFPALRVLYVCQHDFSGPTEKQALGFAQELVRRGHEVLFSLGGDPRTASAEGVDRIAGISVRRHRLTGWRVDDASLSAATGFNPDVLHAMNPRAPTVAAVRSLAKVTGAPVVVHFEDDEWRIPRLEPGAPPRSRVGWVARRALSGVEPRLWWHSTRLSLAWVRRRAAALDALTPALADEVQRRLRRTCHVVLPVAPRVDADRQAEAPRVELPAELNGTPLVVFTGTLHPVYLEDVRIGLRAVAEVQRRGHSLAYVHPGRIHPRLDPQSIAAAAGVRPGTAVFPGMLPFASIGPLLQRATVLLQPGAPTEFNRLRLPAKLQAYLAAGRPVITFATGFGELLEDRREVLKTHTAEPGELADRIVEVLGDEGLAQRLGQGGLEAARRLFDPGSNVDALERVYGAALRS